MSDSRPDNPARQSPVHDRLAGGRIKWQLEWQLIGGMPIAATCRADDAAALQAVGLCDLSGPEKLGVKGPGAADWLAGHVEVPADIYASSRLADGGVIVRLATDEFLLESGVANESAPRLAAQLAGSARVWPVPRQEATFLLAGPRAIDVLSQTCGCDFRQAPRQRLVMTRVAGVNAGVFPDLINDLPAFRLWVDFTYAAYLWDELVEICTDLEGHVVGAACLLPEWR